MRTIPALCDHDRLASSLLSFWADCHSAQRFEAGERFIISLSKEQRLIYYGSTLTSQEDVKLVDFGLAKVLKHGDLSRSMVGVRYVCMSESMELCLLANSSRHRLIWLQ